MYINAAVLIYVPCSFRKSRCRDKGFLYFWGDSVGTTVHWVFDLPSLAHDQARPGLYRMSAALHHVPWRPQRFTTRGLNRTRGRQS